MQDKAEQGLTSDLRSRAASEISTHGSAELTGYSTGWRWRCWRAFTFKFCEFGWRNSLPVKNVAPCSPFFYVYFQFFPNVLKKFFRFFSFFYGRVFYLLSINRTKLYLFGRYLAQSSSWRENQIFFVLLVCFPTNFQAFLASLVVSLVHGFILTRSFPP